MYKDEDYYSCAEIFGLDIFVILKALSNYSVMSHTDKKDLEGYLEISVCFNICIKVERKGSKYLWGKIKKKSGIESC